MIAAAVIGSVHPAFAVIFGKIIGVSFLGFSFFLLFFSRRIGVFLFCFVCGFCFFGSVVVLFFCGGGWVSGLFVLFGCFPLWLEVPVLSFPHAQPLSSFHVNLSGINLCKYTY